MGTLKPQSNERWLVHWPLTGALLHLVERGRDWAGCGRAESPPRCAKCNSPHINGQCTGTNFILFDVALLPLHSKGLKKKLAKLYKKDDDDDDDDDDDADGDDKVLSEFASHDRQLTSFIAQRLFHLHSRRRYTEPTSRLWVSNSIPRRPAKCSCVSLQLNGWRDTTSKLCFFSLIRHTALFVPIEKSVCDILLANNNNLGRIVHRFRHNCVAARKNYWFHTPCSRLTLLCAIISANLCYANLWYLLVRRRNP